MPPHMNGRRNNYTLPIKPQLPHQTKNHIYKLLRDKPLKNLIKYLKFQLPTKNLYYCVYRAALDRFLRYFDRIRCRFTDTEEDVKFVENVNRLRTKYGSCPTKLLEKFRNETDEFAAILHGDFNRNNVLFKYPPSDTNSSLQTSSSSLPVPEDVKMIDFQVSSFECSSSQ